MKENVQGVTDGRNVLNGDTGISRGQNIHLVTKDYFQDLSLKVDVGKINDAVLGFCTLVLSYAKAANKPVNPDDPNAQEMSPKSWIPFMPRTEFITIYSAVKSFFPADNELFDIFNTLACYKTVFTNNDFQVRYVGDVALQLTCLANNIRYRQGLLYWDGREPCTWCQIRRRYNCIWSAIQIYRQISQTRHSYHPEYQGMDSGYRQRQSKPRFVDDFRQTVR